MLTEMRLLYIHVTSLPLFQELANLFFLRPPLAIHFHSHGGHGRRR